MAETGVTFSEQQNSRSIEGDIVPLPAVVQESKVAFEVPRRRRPVDTVQKTIRIAGDVDLLEGRAALASCPDRLVVVVQETCDRVFFVSEGV